MNQHAVVLNKQKIKTKMQNKSIGFIGGGRITQIFLAALKRKNVLPAAVAVNEIDDNVISLINKLHPEVITEKDISIVLKQDYIFVSLHPPVFMQMLENISHELNEKQILISLAPKLSVEFISKKLNGFNRIVRMIPNAPSVINKGFNPVHFSPGISNKDKEELRELFGILGDSPEVEENKLEAYAILTAMGPTYFWFQFYELQKLLFDFGLTDKEFQNGLKKMLEGSLDTMFSGISCKEVNDLIPVKPIVECEGSLTECYNTSLKNIYNKIKAI